MVNLLLLILLVVVVLMSQLRNPSKSKTLDRRQHHCLHVPLLLLQEGVADIDGSCGLVMLELQEAALAPCRAYQGWRAPGFYHEPNGVVGGLHVATQGRTYALLTRRRRAYHTRRRGWTRRSGLRAPSARRRRRQGDRREHCPTQPFEIPSKGLEKEK